MDKRLPELSAVELRRLIGAREVSPVELLEACIARIEAIDPTVNAICAKDYEPARATARLAEAQVMRGEPLGALHGLPLGVKDLQDIEGLLTTHGNLAFRAHVPQTDNTLVARLHAAGAIGNAFNLPLNAGQPSGRPAMALADLFTVFGFRFSDEAHQRAARDLFNC